MQKTTICNYSLVSLRSKKTKETKKTKKTKKTMIPTWAQTQYAKAFYMLVDADVCSESFLVHHQCTQSKSLQSWWPIGTSCMDAISKSISGGQDCTRLLAVWSQDGGFCLHRILCEGVAHTKDIIILIRIDMGPLEHIMVWCTSSHCKLMVQSMQWLCPESGVWVKLTQAKRRLESNAINPKGYLEGSRAKKGNSIRM